MFTAARVRALRAFMGETQSEFAKRLNVERFNVTSWEHYGLADTKLVQRLLALEAANSTATIPSG